MEEDDQIRATPALQNSAKSHRCPTHKRKESDWSSEGTTKRARREQPSDVDDDPKRISGKGWFLLSLGTKLLSFDYSYTSG